MSCVHTNSYTQHVSFHDVYMYTYTSRHHIISAILSPSQLVLLSFLLSLLFLLYISSKTSFRNCFVMQIQLLKQMYLEGTACTQFTRELKSGTGLNAHVLSGINTNVKPIWAHRAWSTFTWPDTMQTITKSASCLNHSHCMSLHSPLDMHFVSVWHVYVQWQSWTYVFSI